jgi:hypothetical protein
MLVDALEALYAAAEIVFITPRSAVRSRPPLPISPVFSIVTAEKEI